MKHYQITVMNGAYTIRRADATRYPGCATHFTDRGHAVSAAFGSGVSHDLLEAFATVADAMASDEDVTAAIAAHEPYQAI